MRALLVASAGGHLVELTEWARRIPDVDSTVWVATPGPQSKALLADENVHWIPDIAPRDFRGTMSLLPTAQQIVAGSGADVVVSTGAAVAVPFFVAARRNNIPSYYIESATRLDGPSLTGRIAVLMPNVKCYTQSATWATSKWKHAGSVFDGLTSAPVAPPSEPLRVVVALGSMRFPFTRLVTHLMQALPADSEVVWQLGHTPAPDGMRGVRIEQFMPHDELADAMAEAHVVVSHAGVGSAFMAMTAGRCPILVPRRKDEGEHVDDHQQQVTEWLAGAGLAIESEASAITTATLFDAASRGIERTGARGSLRIRARRSR